MKWFIFIFFLLLVPNTLFAASFTYSTNDVDIAITTTNTAAKIVLDSRKTMRELTPRTVRIIGIKVWKDEQKTGAPLYQKGDYTIRNTILPTDTLQEHQLTGLSSSATYFVEYFTYNRGSFNTVSAHPTLFRFSNGYSMQATGVDTTIRTTVYGPASPATELALLLRTDTAGGAISTNASITGAGFVRLQPIDKIATGSVSTILTGLEADKTYYVDLVQKHTNGTYTVLYKTSAETTKKEELSYKELVMTPKDTGVVEVAGKIDFEKYRADHPTVPIRYATDIVPGPIMGYVSKKPDFSGEPPRPIFSTATIGGPQGILPSDGSYVFTIHNLTPGQTYYFKQIITTKSGTTIESKVYPFTSDKGILTAAQIQDAFEKHSYRLLAPFPGLSVVMDPALCAEQKNAGKLAPNAICDVNGLINFLLRILIGICAVLLVFRIMINGYNYIVSDIPFLKSKAKTNVLDGALGLGLALSAYVILNTINPKLVENTVQIDSVGVGVNSFEISGALNSSFTSRPVKINFNTEAYPAAKFASEKTGVDIAFILAVFDQETRSGKAGLKGTGSCTWQDPKARMREDDKRDFRKITQELNKNPDTTPVSCALPGGGYGGAIGYTQFLPTTWMEVKERATTALGHTPDPWNIHDALMASAIYLKDLGAVRNERDAACRYYSGRTCDNRAPANSFYGDQVMSRKAIFIKQIETLKREGKIK